MPNIIMNCLGAMNPRTVGPLCFPYNLNYLNILNVISLSKPVSKNAAEKTVSQLCAMIVSLLKIL